MMNEVFDVLSNAPGIVVQDNLAENVYPMPIFAEGYDEVFIGRIRRDYSVLSGIKMWVVADNLRKGAATNAISIMENLMQEKRGD